jgi:sec-independent protein translocase protein TatB
VGQVIFGLSFDKILIIGIIAVVVIGPQRLPAAAARLAQLVRTVRQMADGARDRLKDEMGPEFDDVDWKKLDPRQYDPRRIIREALLDDGDDDDAPPVVRPVVKPVSQQMADGAPAPYDEEAT